jgi:N-acetylglucosamine-6-sulfatase
MLPARAHWILLLAAGLGACAPAPITGESPPSEIPDSGGAPDAGTVSAVDGGTTPRAPNIILIVADDLDDKLFQHMPKTRKLIGAEGRSFPRYFTTYAVCGPSRASMLTGKYPHNHRQTNNYAPNNYEAFFDAGNEARTVAVRLQDLGYKTGFYGKYLNGYGPRGEAGHVPRGWNEWHSFVGDAYFDYRMNHNGSLVSYGSAEKDYSTDVVNRGVREFIEAAEAHDSQPFFLYIAPYAPHSPATAAPRHEGLFQDLPYPAQSDFNEQDISDKPHWLQVAHPEPWGPLRLNDFEQIFRKRVRAVQAVDEMVEDVVEALRARGELENTFVVFTSDNGYHLGEHRLAPGKRAAYEHDIRLPFLVRGPGIAAGQERNHLVLNIDLTPTFVQLAGGSASDVDGKSIAALLGEDPVGEREWRQDFLIMNQEEAGTATDTEIANFLAVRKDHQKYIASGGSAEELYNLEGDPAELTSQHQAMSQVVQQQWKDRLQALSTCRGATCR